MASPAAEAEVKRIYRDFFKRDPGFAALNYWAQQVDAGASVKQVQGYILSTPEGVRESKARVADIYRASVGREPDGPGLNHWLAQLQGGMGLGDLNTLVSTSPEGTAFAASKIPKPPPPPTLTERGVQQGPGTLAPGVGTTPGVIGVGDLVGPDVDYAVIKSLLRSYGLEGLYDDAVGMITGEDSMAEIELKLRETPEFRQRFPQIFEREGKGLSAISPAEVIAYEKQLSTMTSYYGLPINPGDSVRAMAQRLQAGDVSLNEVSERLVAQRVFARQVLDDPNQDREAVEMLMGQGFTLYDVANYAIDPNKTLDQVQRRFEAATVANEAAKTGYRVDAGEATELARLGVDQQAARAGFGQLAVSGQVINALGDEVDPVSRAEELAAVSGDQQAVAKIERSRANRLAANAEGGQFATDREGFGGLK